jgi:hypothetical protein
MRGEEKGVEGRGERSGEGSRDGDTRNRRRHKSQPLNSRAKSQQNDLCIS